MFGPQDKQSAGMAKQGEQNARSVYEILNAYLTRMDASEIGGESLFATEGERERHESTLMYAFRKYQAARYHFENVRRMVSNVREQSANQHSSPDDELRPGSRMSISVRRSADQFVYELAAFMEAIKSSLDFLSTACASYVKGLAADSVRTFIKIAEKHPEPRPPFDVFKRHLSWLKALRDYRHHLVHRMVISTSIGHESHHLGESTTRVHHPVVIPKATPAYVPDTRRFRMMQDDPVGLIRTECGGSVVEPDGTETLLDFSVELRPAGGYAEIREFMASHMEHLESFFSDLTEAMGALEFRRASR